MDFTPHPMKAGILGKGNTLTVESHYVVVRDEEVGGAVRIRTRVVDFGPFPINIEVLSDDKNREMSEFV